MPNYLNTELTPGNTSNGITFVASNEVTLNFNAAASLSGTTLSATFVDTENTYGVLGLSSGTGTLEIDGAYKGATFAVITGDRTSYTFTVPNSAKATTTEVTLTPDGYSTVGRTFLRLRNQGQF